MSNLLREDPSILNDDVLAQTLQSILKQSFKLNAFRPGQREAITALVRQQRLLCIQPTGYGKSLLYQLPSLLLGGVTLVFSPLLALMRDQCTQLTQRFNIPAGSINSDQSDEENAFIQQKALSGCLKILFVAPEKLDNFKMLDLLLRIPLSLLVIDEAHCVSTWGHDFRPNYRQIIHFLRQCEEQNPQIRVLAITATAHQKIEADILQQLSHKGYDVVVQRQTMNRPNLFLDCIVLQSIAEKCLVLRQLLSQLPGSGLIYCSSRENTVLVARFLQQCGFRVAAYHAGLDSDVKRQLQQAFMNNQFHVIVATNALGMGIDKADLRYIIHFDIPGSITAYYQEVGRAGRDGLAARGILLFDEKDKKIQQYFIRSAESQIRDFEAVLAVIKQAQQPVTLSNIKPQIGLPSTRLRIVLAELLEQGFIEQKRIEAHQIYWLSNKIGHVDLSRFERQISVREAELAQILAYAVAVKKQCLMLLLRRALGDVYVEKCGQCSACHPSTLRITQDACALQGIEHWLSYQKITSDLAKRRGLI